MDPTYLALILHVMWTRLAIKIVNPKVSKSSSDNRLGLLPTPAHRCLEVPAYCKQQWGPFPSMLSLATAAGKPTLAFCVHMHQSSHTLHAKKLAHNRLGTAGAIQKIIVFSQSSRRPPSMMVKAEVLHP